MVAFGIVGSRDALASIDFATIVLLFSMMLIVANLRLAGFFDWITERIIQRLHPRHLLPTVIFTSGLLSAFLVNDIVCLVMTPLRRSSWRGASRAAGSVRAGRGDGVEHRQHRHDHRQSAEHADRLAVRHSVTSSSSRGWGRSRSRACFGIGRCCTALYLPGSLDRVPVEEALSAPGFRHAASARSRWSCWLLVLAGFFAGVPAAMVAAIGAALLLITRTDGPPEDVRRSGLGTARLLRRPLHHRRRRRIARV